jgi:hypothetical protein
MTTQKKYRFAQSIHIFLLIAAALVLAIGYPTAQKMAYSHGNSTKQQAMFVLASGLTSLFFSGASYIICHFYVTRLGKTLEKERAQEREALFQAQQLEELKLLAAKELEEAEEELRNANQAAASLRRIREEYMREAYICAILEHFLNQDPKKRFQA